MAENCSSESEGPTSQLGEKRDVLIVPQDNERLLCAGVGRLASTHTIRFGENSLLRERLGDFSNFLWIWSAGLLQAAHPVIGDALQRHSRLVSGGNIWQRFEGSTDSIVQIVVSDDAWKAGHRVRDFHHGIQGRDNNGEMVNAMHSEPFAWAWTTILWMNEQTRKAHDKTQLTSAQWEQWWQEARIAFQCMGVGERHLPRTYDEYRTYFAETCASRLTSTETVLEARRQLETGTIDRPPQIHPKLWGRPVQSGLSRYVRTLAYGGLPSEVRKTFDVPWSVPEQLAFNAINAAMRVASPLRPRRLSHYPTAAEALHSPANSLHSAQLGLNKWLAKLHFKE